MKNVVHSYDWASQRKGYTELTNRGLIKGKKACCQHCLNYAAQHYFQKSVVTLPMVQENQKPVTFETDIPVAEVTDSLTCVTNALCGKVLEDLHKYLQSELSKFATFMGKLIYGTIYDDGTAVGSVFQNLEVKELNT